MSSVGGVKGGKNLPCEPLLYKMFAVRCKTLLGLTTCAQGVLLVQYNFTSTSASLVLWATKTSSSLASPRDASSFFPFNCMGSLGCSIIFVP